MEDNRTMEELLQAPTEGITSTLKFKDVPNDVIKLMIFPYSLEGAAKVWYDKEPSNSILTWDDLVNKFVNQFFPPSMTTHLKNEISRFTQRFKETFGEACERFKEMLRACTHHGFTELTQIDTFYNGLNENDQDSLNTASGGNLLSKITREALNIIENKSKVCYSRNKPNVSRMNTTSRENSTVEESCVICGGPHAYYNCIASDSNQSSVCAAIDLDVSINLMPLSIWKKLSLPELTPTRMTFELANRSITRPKGVAEDVFIKVGKFYFHTDFVVVDFEADPRVNDEAVTFNLNQTMRYSSTYDDMSVNRVNVIDVASEEYAQEVLGFSKNSSGDNPTSTPEPIISNSSPSLTPFEGSDFLLEEIEAYLKDDSVSLEINHADRDPEGDI
nr:reverse transcriptase domain-containing protein [Tanacetum cinerariifolium]